MTDLINEICKNLKQLPDYINGLIIDKNHWELKSKELEKALATYKQAEEDGLLVVLPCKIGTEYAGICSEMQLKSNRGWETIRWLETGEIVGFSIFASMTTEKAGYNHSRNIDELKTVWFVGNNAKTEAEKALTEKEG